MSCLLYDFLHSFLEVKAVPLPYIRNSIALLEVHRLLPLDPLVKVVLR